MLRLTSFGSRVPRAEPFPGHEHGLDHGRAVSKPAGKVLVRRGAFSFVSAEFQLDQQQLLEQCVVMVDVGEERLDLGSLAGQPRLLKALADADDPLELRVRQGVPTVVVVVWHESSSSLPGLVDEIRMRGDHAHQQMTLLAGHIYSLGLFRFGLLSPKAARGDRLSPWGNSRVPARGKPERAKKGSNAVGPSPLLGERVGVRGENLGSPPQFRSAKPRR